MTMSTFVCRWFPRSTSRRSLLAIASEPWLAPEDVVNGAFAELQEASSRLTSAADVRAAIDLVAAERAETEAAGPGYEIVDGVAVVPLTGLLMQEVPSAFDFMGISATSLISARQVLDTALADSGVHAVLLAINSPGGTVQGTSDFADAVSAANEIKPVHAYAMDQAASAAYWIGAQAERLSAGKMSTVGSIGAYASLSDNSQKALKEGRVVHHVASGPEKGVGATDGAPVTEAHRKAKQASVDRAAELFGAAVVQGRGLSAEQLKAVSSGRSWFGVDAVGLGLIDAVGSIDSALEEARAAAQSRNHTPSEGAQHPAPIGATEGSSMTVDNTIPVAPAAEDKSAELAALKAQLAASEAKAEMLGARLGTVKADAMSAVLDKHCGQKFPAADRPAWSARAEKAFAEDPKGLDDFLAQMPDILHTSASGHDGTVATSAKSNKPDQFGLTAEDYAAADNVVSISAVTGRGLNADGEIVFDRESN